MLDMPIEALFKPSVITSNVETCKKLQEFPSS